MNRSPALITLDLLREHLIAVQYADSAYGTEISNLQASLLGELTRRTDPSIQELSRILSTTASTISRQLADLTHNGYITTTKDSYDARRNTYTLTAKGMQFLRLHWRMSEELTQQARASLNKEEVRAVESFLELLLGHDPRSELVALPHESTITLSLRALAFSHGVLSEHFLGSSYSTRDWLIFSEILYNNRTPGQLAELLGVSPSTVSVRLKALEKAGLIINTRDANDARARVLQLTESGKQALTTIEKCAEQVIGIPLKKIDSATRHHYFAAFEKYVHGVRSSNVCAWQASIVEQADLPLLALSAATYIVGCGGKYRHSGYLLHPDNIVIRLSQPNTNPLLIELESVGTSKARLINVFLGTLEDARISPATLSTIVFQVCKRKLIALS